MKLYTSLVLLAVIGLFILQNTDIVEIRFVFWHLTVSRVLLLLGSLAACFVLGVLVTLEIKRQKPAEKIGHE
ncbi:MAG: lipopolysaccharide assembly protein LapA domain-containing protein [bacterium]